MESQKKHCNHSDIPESRTARAEIKPIQNKKTAINYLRNTSELCKRLFHI